LDFDLVVSDLAPIDRIIQRAGRLRRHLRDAAGSRVETGSDQRGEPQQLIYGPAWNDAPDANWFKSVFPKAAFVYPHHGQLWLAARLLREGGFSMPEDARRLIEGVYGEDAQMGIPPGLQASADRAEGQAAAHTSIAHENGLKLETGYVVGDYTDWWRDAVTPTRLGDANSNVRLARWVDGKLLPWCKGEHHWDMSQVRVSTRWISETAVPAAAAHRTEVDRVLTELPDQGKWSVLLPLEQRRDGLWSGIALDSEGEPREWLYCAELGLRLLTNKNVNAGESHEPD
jgi:CRISPR-associated endonuclease/helicase Cas3